MPRPIALTIQIDAMRHNLSTVRRRVGEARIWAVAKADGYGHGIANVVQGFDQADGLAVLDLAEAQIARQHGWSKPILMIEGAFSADDLAQMLRLNATATITTMEQAEMFLAADFVPQAVWIKLNTGMNRLGFSASAGIEPLAAMIARINARLAKPAGLMMHFACADTEAGWRDQFQEFHRLLPILQQRLGLQSIPVSLSNSAAVFALPQAHGDWVRPGIALYGGTPFQDADAGHAAQGLGLVPAQQLTSRVIAIQHIKAGDTVGYGARFRAARASRIGVIAAGYADGYPRAAPDGTPVWVAGRQVPIAGRVSMDLITVDLTDHPQADVGAPVELWGDAVPIDVVANACGTIGYELMTRVTPRVPRKIVDGQR
ncbi:MAG: alanine racemase [Burkholderiaceae bacterium]|nr:alanine racemase [Burkholderiaceae bacterium]